MLYAIISILFLISGSDYLGNGFMNKNTLYITNGIVQLFIGVVVGIIWTVKQFK